MGLLGSSGVRLVRAFRVSVGSANPAPSARVSGSALLAGGGLILAVACALGAPVGGAARAATLASQVSPVSPRLAPQPQGHGSSAAHPLTCGDLLVVVQSAGSSATVREVSCSQGSSLGMAPVSAIAGINQPAVVALSQSGGAGTDCRITLGKSGSTVVLAVRQEACGARSGNVTASVVSGGAVLNGTATGAAARNAPGIVWFTLR